MPGGPFEIDDFEFSDKFWNELSECEKKQSTIEAEKRLKSLKTKIDKYDMIVLDEFLDAILCGCVEKEYSINFLQSIYTKCEIVITGHDEIKEIFGMADYITEMKKVKHPYDRGVIGRDGIEF